MMGCNSCGKNRLIAHEKAANLQSSSQMFPNNLCELDEFKKVRYTGKEQYSKMISSPTGVLVNYGAYKYGMGMNGTIICVHDDDIAARPDLFEVIIEETVEELTEKVIESDVDNLEELVLRTRADALPITLFAEEYGYGHHINVSRAIKEGKLFKYKNEEDGKTYVYHVE